MISSNNRMKDTANY